MTGFHGVEIAVNNIPFSPAAIFRLLVTFFDDKVRTHDVVVGARTKILGVDPAQIKGHDDSRRGSSISSCFNPFALGKKSLKIFRSAAEREMMMMTFGFSPARRFRHFLHSNFG